MRSSFNIRLAVTAIAGLSALILTAGTANSDGVPVPKAEDLKLPRVGGMTVPMDEVRILNFPKAVATVYVANPVVADITVIDNTRVFVLGKNFGSTNIVALDAKGDEILNNHVTVTGRSGSVVRLQRGTTHVTYACVASRCELAPVPGDEKDPFESVTSQMEKRDAQAKSAQGDSSQ